MKAHSRHWLLPVQSGIDPVPLGNDVSRDNMKLYLRCENLTLSHEGENEQEGGWVVAGNSPEFGRVSVRYYYDGALDTLGDKINMHAMAISGSYFDITCIMEIQ